MPRNIDRERKEERMRSKRRELHGLPYTITINVPLFKKLRDIILFAGQSLSWPFQGTF